MKSPSLTIFFSLLASVVFGQIYNYSCHNYYKVKAKSGLNLREKPSAQAPKVAGVAFGAVLLSCEGCDDCVSDTIEGIESRWIRIVFNNKNLYAFGGFLDYLSEEKKPSFWKLHAHSDDWRDKFLFAPGSNPIGFYIAPSDSTKFYLKKIDTKDTLLTDPFFEGGSKMFSKAIDQKEPFFMFANIDLNPSKNIQGQPNSKKMLPGQRLNYKLGESLYSISALGEYELNENGMKIKNLRLNIQLKVRGEHVYNTIASHEYFDMTLNEWPTGGEIEFEGGIFIDWVGDLDQDGKLDMVVSYSETYKGTETILLLSSKAESGHLFKEVARYSHSCC